MAKKVKHSKKVQIWEDLNYLGKSRQEKMDLYLPKSAGKKCNVPVVLMIHGGGWNRGDKAAVRERNIGTNLAKSGFGCASINYLLSEKTGRFTDRLADAWPRNLQDCFQAVRFLRAKADKWGIDPDRIAAMGASAGGHLATLLGSVESGDKFDDGKGKFRSHSHKVNAVVSMYGVHDCLALAEYRDMKLSSKERKMCREASPVNYFTEKSPPHLILHGTEDEIVPSNQAIALRNAAREEGVATDLKFLEGEEHAFHLQPESADLRPVVTEFLKRHLLD